MTKHTQEPWTVRQSSVPDNTGGYDVAIVNQDNEIIAECFEHTGYDKNDRSKYIIQPVRNNAKLIAAAPDLLHAAQWALDWLDGKHMGANTETLLRNAIYKARGEQ